LYRKICPFCKGDSYSAALGRWICPYCNSDLTKIFPEPSGWASFKTGDGGKKSPERKVISICEEMNKKT
jgi:hypothetical protein